MSTQIFSAILTASFAPSSPVLISAGRLSIDFNIVVAGGAATVQWYPEFCSGDPNSSATNWYRELAEEDSAGGVILMPETIRTLADNAGTSLAAGTHNVSAQLQRQHQFARIQIRETAGGGVTANAVVTVPFGTVKPVSGP